jgi:hypothetical protein
MDFPEFRRLLIETVGCFTGGKNPSKLPLSG